MREAVLYGRAFAMAGKVTAVIRAFGAAKREKSPPREIDFFRLLCGANECRRYNDLNQSSRHVIDKA
jgi:hypothetical protein